MRVHEVENTSTKTAAASDRSSAEFESALPGQGRQLPAPALRKQWDRVAESPRVQEFAPVAQMMTRGTLVMQLGGGDGKKKGDDYCNNVGKTLGKALGDLPGFIDDAIAEALAIIGENRHKCAVATSLADAKGADTNTAAYGEWCEALTAAVAILVGLRDETSLKYARGEILRAVDLLRPLLRELPTVAVDPRVAEVIREGAEGDGTAMAAINTALEALRRALLARLRVYAELLWSRVQDNRRSGGGGGGTGGGAGGAAGASAADVTVGGS